MQKMCKNCLVLLILLVLLVSCAEEPEHVHSFDTEWTYDSTYHWHDATCGHDAVSDKAEHSWNDGVVTIEPTHTGQGEKIFTCTVCGITRTEIIPANADDHSYQDEWLTGDSGVKYKTCECGKTYYYGEEFAQYFSVNQNGVLTSVKGKLPEDVIIPTVIDGTVVTEIGERVFMFVTLKNVEIPTSVTKIDANAFDWSDGLANITIPDSVTVIGSSAFCRCNDLTTITIPSSVETIEESTFWSCENLTSVIIFEGTTTIGETAFVFCGNLKEITIPKTVTSICTKAFLFCTGLTDITFNGTASEWEAIIKGTEWNEDVPAEVVHCTDGDAAI